MLGKWFYNETIKSSTAVVGSLFNNLVIKRRDGKVLPVPLSYGPRQKFLEANKAFEPDEEMFEKTLPRMTYELSSMTYDAQRKLTAKRDFYAISTSPERYKKFTASPVPYDLSYTLSIQTKTLNDGWQIVEQILPYFTPTYTVRVRHFPSDASSDDHQPTNTFDMPITLNSVDWEDDWIGDISDRRIVNWTLELTTKVWMHGPTQQSASVILDSRAFLAPNVSEEQQIGLNRGDSDIGIVGEEVGYAQLDSEVVVFREEGVFSSYLDNLSDSDSLTTRVFTGVDNV